MKYLHKYQIFNESKSLMYFDAMEAEEAFMKLAASGEDIPDAVPTNVREWHKFELQIDRILNLLKACKENTILEVFFGNNWKENLPDICANCMKLAGPTMGEKEHWMLQGKFAQILHNYIINGVYDPNANIREVDNYKRSIMEIVNDTGGRTYWHASEFEHVFLECGLSIRSIPPMLSKIYNCMDAALTNAMIIDGRPARLRKKDDGYILESKSIIITVPSTIDWTDYEKEIDAVKDRNQVMNFKVPTIPKVQAGDKCYVVHQGKIKGWMEITGVSEKAFKCTTTGKDMKGKFVERSGPFHYIDPIDMKGFQGYRYYNEINESEAPKTNSYLLVYGKEVNGKKRLYVAKIKGGGSYKRQNADTRMAHLSQDELYIVKEKDGKLIASRCATTNAEKFMGLSSWNVALNDNKTPYHWAAMKYKTAQQVVKELTAAIRQMPNINLD